LRQRGARSVLADFELLDEQENLVVRATGCRFRAVQLTSHHQSTVSNWKISPWLKPHPLDGRAADMPSVTDIVHQIQDGFANIQPERLAWFTKALPLTEG
jgi:hypothetical protein